MNDPHATTVHVRVAFREWFEPVEFCQRILGVWDALGLRPLHSLGKSGPPEVASSELLKEKLKPGRSIPQHYLELRTSRKRTGVDSLLLSMAPQDWDWSSPHSDLGICSLELSSAHMPSGREEECALALLPALAENQGTSTGVIDNLGAVTPTESQAPEWTLITQKARSIGKPVPRWCHLFGPSSKELPPTQKDLLQAGYAEHSVDIAGIQMLRNSVPLLSPPGDYRRAMHSAWCAYTGEREVR